MKKDANGYCRTTVYFRGQRKTIRAKTERELNRKRRELLAQLERGEVVIHGKTTVAQWAEQWMDAYIAPSVGAGTYSNYQGIIKNEINPAIGSLYISEVMPLHCQKILSRLAGKSTSYVSKVRSAMCKMFKAAKRQGLCATNPADDLDMPQTTTGKRRSLTPEERTQFFVTAQHHRAGLFLKMILYCGLRPGECAPLRWADIDFQTGYVKVDKALKRVSGEVGAPKSAAGVRKVPIPAVFLPELLDASRGKSPFDFVFTQQKTGKMHTKSSIDTMWRSFRRQLNIDMGAPMYRNQITVDLVAPDLCMYVFRHTFGTDLQDAGVPINVAKYLMGHSDISVTANVYTDTTDIALEQAREKINGFNQTDSCRHSG